MNKSQLIENLSQAQGLSLKKAASVVETVFEEITKTLVRGERVEVRGFGVFKVKDYGEYVGRRPRDNTAILVKAKRSPLFKAGLELRRKVDGGGRAEESLD